jgi:hypothetical protein
MALITPPKANAEVVIGVGVGARPAYGYVVARPRPYVYVAPAPYVAYGPGYVRPFFALLADFGIALALGTETMQTYGLTDGRSAGSLRLATGLQ